VETFSISYFKRDRTFCLKVFLTLLFASVGCGSARGLREPNSKLAQILMNRVPGLDYDSFSLSLTPIQGGGFSLPRNTYPASDGRLDIKVPAGHYGIVLELLKSGKALVKSSSCPTATRISSVNLLPGPNHVEIPVCPLGPDEEGGPAGSEGKTFSVVNGQLLDPSGKAFVMRGINTPHAYYLRESKEATSRIKEFGFNTVRIVWCADNLVRAERCDTKDMHPVSLLRESLELIKASRMVAVLNLQNATGSDSLDDLEKMVSYLTRPDVKTVLIEYQNILLINIANEWYGTWDKTSNYIEAYRTVIKKLRRAGLPHVLIVDARGYGQDSSSIAEHGKELVSLDENLMISAHLYDVYGRADSVKQVFNLVRTQKLPFLVGEFSCSHGAGKAVACETIMTEASRPDAQYGYIGWSYSGNSSYLQDLDVVKLSDWSTLTPWGTKLIHGVGGIKETSKEACFYSRSPSCK
jgi:mannan endo-1,4-beta-mannosidase